MKKFICKLTRWFNAAYALDYEDRVFIEICKLN